MKNAKGIKKITLCALLVVLMAGCSATIPATAKRIREELQDIKGRIGKNRDFMLKLKSKRIGKTGFFYIIGTDGKVVYHPQNAIIGSNFSNIWFMKKIISQKSGCMKYRLGKRTHVIYFEQINEDEILCFSILSEDMRQPATECMSIEKNMGDLD